MYVVAWEPRSLTTGTAGVGTDVENSKKPPIVTEDIFDTPKSYILLQGWLECGKSHCQSVETF